MRRPNFTVERSFIFFMQNYNEKANNKYGAIGSKLGANWKQFFSIAENTIGPPQAEIRASEINLEKKKFRKIFSFFTTKRRWSN